MVMESWLRSPNCILPMFNTSPWNFLTSVNSNTGYHFLSTNCMPGPVQRASCTLLQSILIKNLCNDSMVPTQQMKNKRLRRQNTHTHIHPSPKNTQLVRILEKPGFKPRGT